VPGCETLRSTTLERLERFRDLGGRVIFMGDEPRYEDALPSGRGGELWRRCERIGFERVALIEALEGLREIDIRDGSGGRAAGLICQLREERGECAEEAADGAEAGAEGAKARMGADGAKAGAEAGSGTESAKAGSGEASVRWLFVAHARAPKNKDIVQGDVLKIRARGAWRCTLYDTLSGCISPLESAAAGDGWTEISYPLYDHDSLLLKLDSAPESACARPSAGAGAETCSPASANAPVAAGSPAPLRAPALALDIMSGGRAGRASVPPSSGKGVLRFDRPVRVTLEEPNALLLDMAEYALDGEAYRPREEILRLDNELRERLGWPLRLHAVAQPWVEKDEATPRSVSLRYTFASHAAITGAKLALERSELAEIRLNGRPVAAEADGWYVDKCIQTIPLPELAAGENTLEVRYRFGKKVDLEAMYLLGRFGVRVSGSHASLAPEVAELSFGDITGQGLPFYGGNIAYRLPFDWDGGSMRIDAPCYRGQMIDVALDGKPAGSIVWSPYRLVVHDVPAGRRELELRLMGSRVNTFGQLHCNVREPGFWWGPDSWRTTGPKWTYEYRFWRQGILKSPEISREP
jgi:hypothetical protein